MRRRVLSPRRRRLLRSCSSLSWIRASLCLSSCIVRLLLSSSSDMLANEVATHADPIPSSSPHPIYWIRLDHRPRASVQLSIASSFLVAASLPAHGPSAHPSILLRYLTIPPNPSIISLISYLFLAVLILVVVFLSAVPLPPSPPVLLSCIGNESSPVLRTYCRLLGPNYLLLVSCTIFTHRPAPTALKMLPLYWYAGPHIIYIPSLYILALRSAVVL